MKASKKTAAPATTTVKAIVAKGAKPAPVKLILSSAIHAAAVAFGELDKTSAASLFDKAVALAAMCKTPEELAEARDVAKAIYFGSGNQYLSTINSARKNNVTPQAGESARGFRNRADAVRLGLPESATPAEVNAAKRAKSGKPDAETPTVTVGLSKAENALVTAIVIQAELSGNVSAALKVALNAIKAMANAPPAQATAISQALEAAAAPAKAPAKRAARA